MKRVIIGIGFFLLVMTILAFLIYQSRDKWPVLPKYPNAQNLKITETQDEQLISYTVEGIKDSRTVIWQLGFELTKLDWEPRFPAKTGASVKVLLDKQFFGLTCTLYVLEEDIKQEKENSSVFVNLKLTRSDCANYATFQIR